VVVVLLVLSDARDVNKSYLSLIKIRLGSTKLD